MKMEQTECSETSTYKIQTPGNHPKESIQHSGHGESLKSRIEMSYFTLPPNLYYGSSLVSVLLLTLSSFPL